MSRVMVVAFVLAGCQIAPAAPPYTGGDGIEVAGGKVSVRTGDGLTVSDGDVVPDVGADLAINGGKLALSAATWARIDDHAAPLPTCDAGKALVRTADGWGCGTFAADGRDYVVTPEGCPPGTLLERKSNGWDCVSPATLIPFPESCPVGSSLVQAAGGWECMPVRAIPDPVGCSAGEVLVVRNGAYECGRESELAAAGVGCTDGNLLTFSGGHWSCEPAPASYAPPTTGCAANHLLTFDGSSWVCRPPPTELPAPTACAGSTVLTRTASGWDCAPLPPSIAPPSGSCAEGSVLTNIGNSWTCRAVPTELPVTGCSTGQVLTLTATGWTCQALPAAIAPPTGSCADGTVLTRQGGAFICATIDLSVLAPKPSGTCSGNSTLQWNGSGFTCVATTTTLPSYLSALTSLFTPADRQLTIDSTQSAIPLQVGVSLGAQASALPSGKCLSIAHGWNTAAVGYSAWMTDRPAATAGAKWVPVPLGADVNGRTNLAQGRPTSASSILGNQSTLHHANAVDGRLDTRWGSEDGQWAGYWQVELYPGVVGPVTTVRMQTANSAGAGSDTARLVAWDIAVSANGVSFARVASGSCSVSGSCSTLTPTQLPAGTSARFVRVIPTAMSAGSGWIFAEIYEFEAYAGDYTLSQPDANTVRYCNFTGETRDLALRIWR